MWAVRFIFIACSSIFIARVASEDICPDMDHYVGLSYEPAFVRSINEFLKDLRGGVRHLTTRFTDTSTIDGYTIINVRNSNDNLRLKLKNLTLTISPDVRVTDVNVNSHDTSRDIDYLFHIEVPIISGKSDYYFKGIWIKQRYTGHEQLEFHIDNVKARVRLLMTLTDDGEHWRVKKFRFKHKNVVTGKQEVHLGYAPLDNLVYWESEVLKQDIIAQIKTAILKHFTEKVRDFLDELLKKVRWYAFIFGKFNPDDRELFHGKTVVKSNF